MDATEMREALVALMNGMDWSEGADKSALLRQVAGDEALTRIVDDYVAEGQYKDAEHVLTVIPVQAWQDAQGDVWRGASTLHEIEGPGSDNPALR